MENASKALIIAGAILLSILLISLGIMVYRQASGVVNSNSMTELEITSFNEQFEQYYGSKVRGSVVNSLLNKIKTSNLANEDQQVELDQSGTIQSVDAHAESGKTYDVKTTETSTGGLITKIYIKEVGSSTPTPNNP